MMYLIRYLYFSSILLPVFRYIQANDDDLNNIEISYNPLSQNWHHLSYDGYDYVCRHYTLLCNNFLDEIGCKQSSRSVLGCNPDLISFAGTCQCLGDPVAYDMGGRITKQIIDNRIKPEVGWMLEPWSSGPPFSVEATYPAICSLALTRLGCPDDQKTIKVGYTSNSQYACTCGKFSATSRIQELICDKSNEALLMEMPIFADPVQLSVELSIAIVLIVGKLCAIVATLVYLPPVIGFILGGIAIQDIVSSSLIKGAGGDGPHVSTLIFFVYYYLFYLTILML